MRRTFYLLAILALAFASCKKDNAPAGPDPIAEFTVSNSYLDDVSTETITIATYDGFTLVNKSENGEEYLWDFGNGTTSTDKNPGAWYEKAGTYTVALTVSKKDGRTAMSKKTLKVLDRVAKQIVVRSINNILHWDGAAVRLLPVS